MNYHKHYNNLIERARHRYLTTYTETHHVLPKCLGGSNDANNLVCLTPEEHYVAHQFLVKMHPKNRRLLWGLHRMSSGSYKNPRNNKLYGWIRKRASKAISGTKNHMSKLTESQVIDIYYSTKHTKELCQLYNIGASQVLSVKKKKSYKSVVNSIPDLPGVHPSIRRIPLSDETIRQIYLDQGDTKHFKEKYRTGIAVVRRIKEKFTYKSATKGLHKPGQIATYKLLPHEVFAIKNSTKTNKELAKAYNVCADTIHNIKSGKTRFFTDIILN